MTIEEQAELILNHLSNVIQINWALKEYYLQAITRALKEIKKEVQR